MHVVESLPVARRLGRISSSQHGTRPTVPAGRPVPSFDINIHVQNVELNFEDTYLDEKYIGDDRDTKSRLASITASSSFALTFAMHSASVS